MDLRELREKLACRASLEEELESLRLTKYELEKRLRREEQNLEYEQSDVQDMTDNTLKNLFYSVLGKQEARLKKEEDEALEAEEQVERTQEELKEIIARIRRVEFELRQIKRAQQDYNRQTEALSTRIAKLQPILSDADAMTVETVQREIAEQQQHQAHYVEIAEVGRQLSRTLGSITQALVDMRYDCIHDNHLTEWEYLQEARELRDVAYIQTQRLQEVLTDVKLGNDYCLDPTDIDNTIRRARIRSTSAAPNADLCVPDTPSLTLNVSAILNELERKTEASKRHQAAMEIKLSELLEKYETT